MSKGQLHVVLLESSQRGVSHLIERYKEIFGRLGYEIKITVLDYEKKLPLDGRSSVFHKEVVDVFISDLSLGKGDSFDGLLFIQKIKADYPDMLVIANSRTSITCSKAANRIPTFDIFIDKTRLHEPKYKEYLTTRVGELLRKNVHAWIDFEDSELSDTFKSTVEKIALENMVRTITFNSHNSDLTTCVSRVKLLPLAGGMSGSDVYRMYAFTASGLQCVNAVLKLSKIEDAKKEIENYFSYVKWYLPYTWRSELLGYSYDKTKGAICHSFVYNDDVTYNSLTSHIQNGDSSKIEMAVDSIFKPTYQRWYHKRNVVQEKNITETYYARWFSGRKDVDDMIKKVFNRYDLSRRDYVKIKDEFLPLPRLFLLGSEWGDYMSCICHGDLNSNNILVSEKDDLAFIDFRHTGRGHVFEDFVTFEASLRFYGNNLLSFDECYDKELSINKGVAGIMYGDQIRLLRKHARDNNFNEDNSKYYYLLALFCYRMFRLKMSKGQADSIAACLMASIKELKDMGYS